MKILITGASRGIGKAIAEEFLAFGHEVIGIDVLRASISADKYTHYTADISSDELPELSGIEILINNAGVQNGGRDIDVNLKATIHVTEKYGFGNDVKSILFIASASGSTGAEFPEYAASKGGVIAYMKNVALRSAGRGVTVNSLSPGGVLTQSNAHVTDDPVLYKAVLDEALLHKWASVEEIAKWAYFLTVVNKSMTAQDLLVDNGEAAKANFIW